MPLHESITFLLQACTCGRLNRHCGLACVYTCLFVSLVSKAVNPLVVLPHLCIPQGERASLVRSLRSGVPQERSPLGSSTRIATEGAAGSDSGGPSYAGNGALAGGRFKSPRGAYDGSDSLLGALGEGGPTVDTRELSITFDPSRACVESAP